MAKMRRKTTRRSGNRRRRPRVRKEQVLKEARKDQRRQGRTGAISATEDPHGEKITLHTEDRGKTSGRVLEVRGEDVEAGTVPVEDQIDAFVRRQPPSNARSKRTTRT